MQINLTLEGAAALLVAMAVLAAVPSVSVLTVAARSAGSGLAHGALAAAGIVAGDTIFILVAIFGLSALADALGEHLDLLRYVAAAYLVWLGVALWRTAPRGAITAGAAPSPSRLASFLAGLLVTLGDHKAILFYLAFFPAFVDLSALSMLDAAVVVAIAAVAVGGVKLGYALAAHRAGARLGARAARGLSLAAGGVMIAVGIVLAVGV